jgi:serine/threonine protein phosphatase PrpC
MDSHDVDTVELANPPIAAVKYFVKSACNLVYEFGAATHAGLCRPDNQDHYVLLRRTRTQQVIRTSVPTDQLPVHPCDEAYAMAVADGMSGTSGGDLASQLAIRAAWDLTAQTISWVMRLGCLNSSELTERIEGFTHLMQQAFLEEFQANPKFGDSGTTWTSAYIVDTFAIIAQIGDSPCLRWRDGTLARISIDHTIEQEFLTAGVPPEQAGKCRHLLTRCFGARTPNARPDVYQLRLQAGDQLLLCTDGLTDMVSPECIAKCLEESLDPQCACESLIGLALAAGGKDNITVLLARAR